MPGEHQGPRWRQSTVRKGLEVGQLIGAVRFDRAVWGRGAEGIFWGGVWRGVAEAKRESWESAVFILTHSSSVGGAAHSRQPNIWQVPHVFYNTCFIMGIDFVRWFRFCACFSLVEISLFLFWTRIIIIIIIIIIFLKNP